MTDSNELPSPQALRQFMKKWGIGLAVASAAWVIIAIVIVLTSRDGWQRAGALGEAAAVVGTLAAAAALSISAYSLILQRHELSAQREEMKRSADAQESLAIAQARDSIQRKWEQLLAQARRVADAVESEVAKAMGQVAHGESLGPGTRSDYISSTQVEKSAKAWAKYEKALQPFARRALLAALECQRRALEAVASDTPPSGAADVAKSLNAAELDWQAALRNVRATHFVD